MMIIILLMLILLISYDDHHIVDEDLRVETFYSKDLMLLLLNKLHISWNNIYTVLCGFATNIHYAPEAICSFELICMDFLVNYL